MEFIIETLLIGIGLSMDAFAVAVCKGLAMRKVNKNQALIIAAFFGGFQALMPWIGWALGMQFRTYIEAVDHWIAFGLLLFIGGKMILDAWKERKQEFCAVPTDPPLDLKELTLLAIATSIDAFAVGISFAALQTPIYPSIALIGCTTFALSMVGVCLGKLFGSRFQSHAQLLGGIILVGIGIKILIEHLGGMA